RTPIATRSGNPVPRADGQMGDPQRIHEPHRRAAAYARNPPRSLRLSKLQCVLPLATPRAVTFFRNRQNLAAPCHFSIRLEVETIGPDCPLRLARSKSFAAMPAY